ncbi:TPA: hypothetical protein ACIVK4_004473, partial [Salmonella enterica subsp. enterica serovar Jangwani]|nr:hypothetical protein [Salmonella enterica subsp. enterica serovar Muenchen]
MDFSKKNNELKQTRQPAKIFLHNSVLLKITGGNAEISMDNNIHTDVKIDTGMILYIEKGTSISFRHMKSNHNDSVKVIELEECLLRNILPIISHLSFNGFTESPVNVKKYFLTKERKYASHIFDEFNGLRIN